MPNLAERLLQTSSSKRPQPTNWQPDETPLSVGYSERRDEYWVPASANPTRDRDAQDDEDLNVNVDAADVGLGSFSSLKFELKRGSWAVGTLVFKRLLLGGGGGGGGGESDSDAATRVGQLPGYDGGYADDNKDDLKRKGNARVTVVSRFNKSELRDGTRVNVDGNEFETRLVLQTADATPIAAAISYHVTVELPPGLTALNGLEIDADRFKVVFDPSLAQSLSIATLKIRTGDAPVQLALTDCGNVDITNENRLNPSKTSLKHHDDLVSGTLTAESIVVQCLNGSVGGEFTTKVGPLVVSTSNFSIAGTYTSAADLKVVTSNASLSGTFVSKSTSTSASGGITVELQQTKVDNAVFVAPSSGVRITNKLSPVSASFTVAKHLIVKTTGFPIDARVTLASSRSRSASEARRPSLAAPPSFVSASSSAEALPTFEDAISADTGSRTTKTTACRVSIDTTDGHVNVAFENHPRDVALVSQVATTGGARAWVSHPVRRATAATAATAASNGSASSARRVDTNEDSGFVGTFRAQTGGLTSNASVRLMSVGGSGTTTDANGTGTTADDEGVVRYDVDKRSEVSGNVLERELASLGGGASSARSSTMASSSNGPAEIEFVPI